MLQLQSTDVFIWFWSQNFSIVHFISTGYGLEKGGFTTILHNTLDTDLTVIYMETIPWYLRVYFSSIQLEANKQPVKPCKCF
jgi:hypothetical protein